MTRSTASIGVIALGTQAALAQIVILRAGLERFGGNEFFIGISLTAWLVTGAVGSAIFGRLADHAGRRRSLIRLGAAMVPAGTCLSLLILHVISTGLTPAGISPSPLSSAGWMALATAPAAATSGVLFAWLVSVLSSEYARGLGLTTILESIGAAVGALLLGSLMIDQLGNPGLVALTFITGVIAICCLVPVQGTRATVALLVVSVLFATGGALMSVYLTPYPAGSAVLERVENRHGRYTSVARDGQHSVMNGSRTVADCQNLRTPEILAATVSAFAPEARRILAPGGTSHELAMLGALPDHRVTLVTANRDLEDLVRRACNQNERNPVGLIVQDPMRHIDTDAGHWDAIVLRTGIPDTLERARTLTETAFNLMARRLKPHGTLFVTLGAVHAYPGDAEIRVLAGVLNAAARSFKSCRILPLEDWTMVCGNAGPDLNSVSKNLRGFPVPRRYATDGFFADALDPMELEILDQRIQTARQVTPPNSALSASVQINALLDWAGMHAPVMSTDRFAPNRSTILWTLLLLPLLTLLPWIGGALKRPEIDAYAISGVTGAIGITVELAIMNAVQAAYGSLQHWLGGMIAAYMAGLGLGAFLGWRLLMKMPDRTAQARRISVLATGMTSMAAAGACVAMTSGLHQGAGLPISMVVMTACATACGAAFQIASQRLREISPAGSSQMTGLMRGIDTAAAGVAAILATIVFLPVAGTVAVLGTCGVACLILALHKPA